MDIRKPKRILIIDDDVDFCHLMIKILENNGYAPECAFTLGDSVDKLVATSVPAVILLDYGMPDGSGLSFFKEHHELFDQHEVILISADPSEVLDIQVKQAGILHFLPKPVPLGTLLSVIRKSA